MTIPLNTSVLGYLIEKGYYFVLAKNEENDETGILTITLFPIREKPVVENLPHGFETYYHITQEPMQMACGIDNSTIVVIDVPLDENMPDLMPADVLEDNTFRLSEDFYKQVVESLEEYAVITTDKLGDVSSWNKGAERLLGYSEEEILGKKAHVFFTEKDQESKEPEKELEMAIKNGKAIDERYHVRKDKSVFWGSGLVFPLFDTHNVHRGFTKIMRNLEERKDAERHRPQTRL
ncbi:PAS domain S-box protein [Pedobacter sp. P351]|uniref:PAS domain-containing protein n=1 Tax=Pedobacter superstes TaxID=3133441 RepID=UPI00309A5245